MTNLSDTSFYADQYMFSRYHAYPILHPIFSLYARIPFMGFGEREAEVMARGISPWAWIPDLRELLELVL